MYHLKATIGVLLTISSQSAIAGIAYNNFGPGDSFDPIFNHYMSTGPNDEFGNISLRPGEQFVSLATGDVSSLRIVISNSSGNPEATLRLHADSGSNTIGAQVGAEFTFAVQGSLQTGGVVNMLDVSAAGWSLVSGQTYWLTAQAGPGSVQVWAQNSIGDRSGWHDDALGSDATIHNYVAPGNIPHGVFSIEVIPAPASLTLLSIACIASTRRRR